MVQRLDHHCINIGLCVLGIVMVFVFRLCSTFELSRVRFNSGVSVEHMFLIVEVCTFKGYLYYSRLWVAVGFAAMVLSSSVRFGTLGISIWKV